MTTLEIVERGTILRGTVGSTVHGFHHGGQDDRDEMAVFVEPPEYLIGLRLARKHGVHNPYRFEHWIERTQPEGARSGPGDLDLVGQKRVNRPELVEAHGFDTKYAMHALRLGYQGVELLESGRVTLPMPEPERSRVMAVRRGERSFDEVLAEIGEVEQRLEAALEQTTLPESPDDDAVNAFLVGAYRQAWGW